MPLDFRVGQPPRLSPPGASPGAPAFSGRLFSADRVLTEQ
jgi:hypothetical protein